MTDYQPKPNDQVLLTVRAQVDNEGHFAFIREGDRLTCITKDSPAIVSVAPAPIELPTGFGARIRATVRLPGREQPVENVRLVLAPFSAHDVDPWSICHSDVLDPQADRWARAEQLSDVVVLDPGEPS